MNKQSVGRPGLIVVFFVFFLFFVFCLVFFALLLVDACVDCRHELSQHNLHFKGHHFLYFKKIWY